MKNKIQDIVPLEVTNVTVSSDGMADGKLQSNKSTNGSTRQRLQSVPVISVISGNIDDEIQNNYSQGTWHETLENCFKHKPIFDFEFKMPMFNDDIKFCVQGQTKGQEDFQEFQPVQWVRNSL